MTKGHASPQADARMEALEAKLRRHEIRPEERLELALLNLEPGHDGFRALELLSATAPDDPGFELSRVWMAYVQVYELMDPAALREALRLCAELLARPAAARLRAAALLLQATALRELDKAHDSVAPLLAAIALEPEWISSRQLLAQIYLEQGRRADAGEQLRQAIAVSRPEPGTAELADRLFEQLIAVQGLPGTRAELERRLRSLEERR